MDVLVYLVAAVVSTVGISSVRRRRSTAAARGLATGRIVKVPATLRGDRPPYPRRARRGRVVVAGGPPMWRGVLGGIVPLALRITGTVVPRNDPGGVRVVGTDPTGVRVELVTPVEYGEVLRSALDGPRPPATHGHGARAGARARRSERRHVEERCLLRGRHEGWLDSGGRTTATWAPTGLRRLQVPGAGIAATCAVVALVLVLMTGPWWWTARRLARGDLVVSPGVVEEVAATLPLLPDEAFVTLETADGPVEVTVPVSSAVRADERVMVEHASEDPDRARLVGPGDRLADGTRRGALAAAAAIAAAPIPLARRRLRRRRWLTLRSAPASTVRYVMTRDPWGDEPALVLYDPGVDDPPVGALPLERPVPPGVAVAGDATVHGELAHGAPVLPVIDDAPLVPAGVLSPFDDPLRIALVEGDVLGAQQAAEQEPGW
jgi:hypothetical protein